MPAAATLTSPCAVEAMYIVSPQSGQVFSSDDIVKVRGVVRPGSHSGIYYGEIIGEAVVGSKPYNGVNTEDGPWIQFDSDGTPDSPLQSQSKYDVSFSLSLHSLPIDSDQTAQVWLRLRAKQYLLSNSGRVQANGQADVLDSDCLVSITISPR
jgi:hypothetical protein